MDEADELRTYMNAASRELEVVDDPHPGFDALTAYQRGRLSGSALALVRDHLVVCDECLALFRDANAFFAPPAGGGVSDIEIRGGWKELWRQVEAEDKAEDKAAAPAVAPGAAATHWLRKAWAPALAAGLALAVALPVMWAVWSARPAPTAAGQSQLEQKEMAERLKQLEEQNRQLREQVREQTAEGLQTNPTPADDSRASQLAELERENLRLREQLGALRQSRETELAELRRPRLNAPLYDVLPREMTVRSAADEEVTRVELPPGQRSFTLILNGGGVPPYPSYDIEISARGGRKVWRGSGLRPEGNGNFVLSLDRSFLRDGRYSLKLFGRSPEGSKAAAEYSISVGTGARRERR